MAKKQSRINHRPIAKKRSNKKGKYGTPKPFEDDYENAHFFIENQKMSINENDWPAQRRYLLWWQEQVNKALLSTKKDIGKAITINIVGESDKDVLKKDTAKVQNLLIEVNAHTEGEFRKMIMNKLKGK